MPHLRRSAGWLEAAGGKRELIPTEAWRLDAAAIRLAIDAAGASDAAEAMEKVNAILETYREMVK